MESNGKLTSTNCRMRQIWSRARPAGSSSGFETKPGGPTTISGNSCLTSSDTPSTETIADETR